MSVTTEPTIRDISDTAIWAAIYRARETERTKALFRDPFAKRLTGERGERIAAVMKSHDKHEWAWVMRTVLFDGFISEEEARAYFVEFRPELFKAADRNGDGKLSVGEAVAAKVIDRRDRWT